MFRRKSRSSRNRPAAHSARRSALVAEIIRTLTRCVFDEPTRSISPVSSTRSSLACWRTGILAISSRNSVPPLASSKRPMRSARASVKAPFTWPKSSLSNVPSGRAPVFTATSVRSARDESRCSVCATTSLPLPCSPVIRTFASEGPIARHRFDHGSHRRSRRDEIRRSRSAQNAVLRLKPLRPPLACDAAPSACAVRSAAGRSPTAFE